MTASKMISKWRRRLWPAMGRRGAEKAEPPLEKSAGGSSAETPPEAEGSSAADKPAAAAAPTTAAKSAAAERSAAAETRTTAEESAGRKTRIPAHGRRKGSGRSAVENHPLPAITEAAGRETLDSVEEAHKEWMAAQAYFDSVTDPGLIDHAIFLMTAAEKRYIFLINEARREGLAFGGLAAAYADGPTPPTPVRRLRRRNN